MFLRHPESDNNSGQPDTLRGYNEEVSRYLNTLRNGTAIGVNALHACDVRVERVTDVSAAPRLSHRHQSSFIPPRLISCVMDLLQNPNDPTAKAAFAALRADVKRNGMFLMPYDDEFMRRRLVMDGHDGGEEFLIMEAWGRHPDMLHARGTIASPAADAQFKLPAMRNDATPVVNMPIAGDEILLTELLEEIQSEPWSVALFEDLSCDPDMMRTSCAKRAAVSGLTMIRDEINPRRGEYPIKHVLAEIGIVTGMKLRGKDGEPVSVSFHTDCLQNPLKNDRCFEIIEFVKDHTVCTPFETVYIRKNVDVPVHGHANVVSITTDWHVKGVRYCS